MAIARRVSPFAATPFAAAAAAAAATAEGVSSAQRTHIYAAAAISASRARRDLLPRNAAVACNEQSGRAKQILSVRALRGEHNELHTQMA